MEKNVTDKFVMERKTIFDKARKKRFELTFQIQGEKEQKKNSGNRLESGQYGYKSVGYHNHIYFK